jgi:hypothetical protein
MQKLGDLRLEVPIDEDLNTYNVKITMLFGGYISLSSLPIFPLLSPYLPYHLPLSPITFPSHEDKNLTMIVRTEISVKAEHVVTKKAVSCHLEFAFTAKTEISALPLPLN